ncbi:hypothetical protein Sjap_002472 [Stephania japonica]|uniref:Uncharacterized protein n=1 Tax=Stephania japonica TaxID=461633 RepID=A0AAP0KLX5_9MAGN
MILKHPTEKKHDELNEMNDEMAHPPSVMVEAHDPQAGKGVNSDAYRTMAEELATVVGPRMNHAAPEAPAEPPHLLKPHVH